MLNIILRGNPISRDQLTTFVHTTDMICARGIGYSINFVLMPKSGFQIHLIMFQTPYDMDQLSEQADESLTDNMPSVDVTFSKQGSYAPNGKLLSLFNTNDKGKYHANICKEYAYIFGLQKKVYDNILSSSLVQNMKVNHPNVTIPLDHHLTAINHQTKPKMFGIN